jgi:ribosomal protein S18 acetylase RimI-like enzyme
MVQVRIASTQDSKAIGSIIRGESLHFLVEPEGEEAQRFYAALEPDAIEKSMTEPSRCYLVAEEGSKIVGMIMIRDNSYISQFFVVAQYQGRGIGAKLCLALQNALSAGGSGEFKVDSSLVARPVYESLGFVAVGEPTVRSGFKFIPMHRPVASAA